MWRSRSNRERRVTLRFSTEEVEKIAQLSAAKYGIRHDWREGSTLSEVLRRALSEAFERTCASDTALQANVGHQVSDTAIAASDIPPAKRRTVSSRRRRGAR